jgi:4-hydroxybenzoate polyprenyltransferase
MQLLTKFINFVLYSNLWIAIAAVTMTAKTLFFLNEPIFEWTPVYGFVFSATLFIYAGHRVIGLKKSEAFADKGRYKIIAEHKSHIIIYAVLGFMGTFVFAFMLSWKTWLYMAVPGLISIGYIFPIFSRKEKKRLRDFDDIKIYFVAGVWTVVSVVLPFIEYGHNSYSFLTLSILEVFLFVFAITIPFDIRDLNVDSHNQVQTIPARIGIVQAKRIALLLLVLSYIMLLINVNCLGFVSILNNYILIFISISYLVSYLLIYYSDNTRKDFYYTGFLDGTMILLPIFIIVGGLF